MSPQKEVKHLVAAVLLPKWWESENLNFCFLERVCCLAPNNNNNVMLFRNCLIDDMLSVLRHVFFSPKSYEHSISQRCKGNRCVAFSISKHREALQCNFIWLEVNRAFIILNVLLLFLIFCAWHGTHERLVLTYSATNDESGGVQTTDKTKWCLW
jgi:hypothetical protein